MKSFALLFSLAACGDPTVRLCNDTGFDINAVAWDAIYTTDSLSNGQCTDYETPTHDVYRYTRVAFRVQTDEFLIQPIDYVGEDPLDAGEWSYHLTIADYASRIADVAARRD